MVEKRSQRTAEGHISTNQSNYHHTTRRKNFISIFVLGVTLIITHHDSIIKLKVQLKGFLPDRAISDQICDERTKFDILCAFVNVSLCLTHRKHSIQRALDCSGSGQSLKYNYVERAWKMYQKFLEPFKVKNFIQNRTRAI